MLEDDMWVSDELYHAPNKSLTLTPRIAMDGDTISLKIYSEINTRKISCLVLYFTQQLLMSVVASRVTFETGMQYSSDQQVC